MAKALSFSIAFTLANILIPVFMLKNQYRICLDKIRKRLKLRGGIASNQYYYGENWMWCGKSMTIKHSQFSYTPLCWEDTIFSVMGKVFPSLAVRMEYRSLLVLVQSCNKVNVFDQVRTSFLVLLESFY